MSTSDKFVVIIDADLCKGCKLCVDFCPRDVLRLSDKINRLGYHPAVAAAVERCIGCQACVLVCPEGAIELYRGCAAAEEVSRK